MLLKGLNLLLMFGSVLLIMFLYLAVGYLRSRIRMNRHTAQVPDSNNKEHAAY